MKKLSYASLKLKVNTDVTTFNFNGNEIEILKYLPIEDKYTLINVTLQNAKEGNIYNQVLLDAYFHLFIIMMYTNITFTDKQREDLLKLYDCLESNGLINLVLMNMDQDEYDQLYQQLIDNMESHLQYDNTAAGIINNIIEKLPERAEEMQKILDNFDQNKFQNVLDFAKAANGGRDINN